MKLMKFHLKVSGRVEEEYIWSHRTMNQKQELWSSVIYGLLVWFWCFCFVLFCFFQAFFRLFKLIRTLFVLHNTRVKWVNIVTSFSLLWTSLKSSCLLCITWRIALYIFFSDMLRILGNITKYLCHLFTWLHCEAQGNMY